MKPISQEEVKCAVWALDPESAAGPDGFNGEFFWKCKNIVADDVYTAVLDFFVAVSIPKAHKLSWFPKKKDNPPTFPNF